MKKNNYIAILRALCVIGGIAFLLEMSGCAKNTVIFEPDEEESGGNNIPKGSTLVTFNASVEGRNLLTRSMSPMEKGIQNRLFAYKASAATPASATPEAQGLYITTSPGVLIGSDGYKMYLENGVYDFYAVSDNFSTIPPTFHNRVSEPLFNGIDYLWWHSLQQDVNSSQIQIPIVYLHAATQVVFEIAAGNDMVLNKLVSAMITPSKPGASMDIATGIIPPSTSYGEADKMGINGFLAQYIMLPLQTTAPMMLVLEVMVNGETDSRTYEVQVPLPNGELKAGDSYLYRTVIDENAVIFPSVSIKHWTDVDETGKPLYPYQE